VQKRKIAHKCEIALIAHTSHLKHEAYYAYVYTSHICANMTFTLRTHCLLNESYVCFLQCDICAISSRWHICRIFSMSSTFHCKNIRTYVSSGSSYLCAISVECTIMCIVYNATYVSFCSNLIYVSFRESHLCRIHYHMRRMSHLLLAMYIASASTCHIRLIYGMQDISHLESPLLTSR
jgi:hypothetical protein